MKQMNRQYAYTSASDVALGIVERHGWIPVKNGQTIETTIENRVKQQDIASTTTDLIVVDKIMVYDNTDVKYDDKIRDIIHTKKNFLNYVRKDKNKRNEWTWVYALDIIEDLKLTYDTAILEDERFLEAFKRRIYDAKMEAIEQLQGKAGKDIVLRSHQVKVLENMIESNKNNFLLSLAPRFGKTFLVLEYAYNLAKDIDNLVIVVASKSLTSNTSFSEDYKDGGYANRKDNFKLFESSLFKTEEKMMKALYDDVDKNANVILVTDEGDFASSTTISTDKLDLIRSKYNVIKNIVMTGTGIWKAAKILKDVDAKDLCKISMNYTELKAQGENVVGRNFINVKLNHEGFPEDVLNIRQSFNNDYASEKLAEYLKLFIDDKATTRNLRLKKADVVMVFTSAPNNELFNQFVDNYSMQNPSTEIVRITGTETSNREAQKLVRTKLHEMREMKNTNQLVAFSNGMASRSFSIPEIDRVIEMKDTEITDSSSQKFARVLTWKPGKDTADIIRLSFEDVMLAEEVFMQEYESLPNDKKKAEDIIEFFLSENSFSEVIMNDKNGIYSRTTLKDVGAMIDRLNKFREDANYLVTRLHGTGVTIEDVENATQQKSVTKTVKAPTVKQMPKSSTTKALSKEDEKALKAYLRYTTIIPAIAVKLGYSVFKDFLNASTWNDYIAIDRAIFLQNLKIDEFAYQMEAIFRGDLMRTDNELNAKLLQVQ